MIQDKFYAQLQLLALVVGSPSVCMKKSRVNGDFFLVLIPAFIIIIIEKILLSYNTY